jgi:hypothetical protein
VHEPGDDRWVQGRLTICDPAERVGQDGNVRHAILQQMADPLRVALKEVARLRGNHRPRADELTLARIARERDDAARRLAKTRDLVAWTATMARLDAEEDLAHVPLDGRRLTPTEIVDYLRSLPTMWADSGTTRRHAIVSATFAYIDVFGFERNGVRPERGRDQSRTLWRPAAQDGAKGGSC